MKITIKHPPGALADLQMPVDQVVPWNLETLLSQSYRYKIGP